MKKNSLIPLLFITIFVGSIVTYVLFRFYALWAGPVVEVIYPTDGQTISADYYDMQIRTKRVSKLSINNKNVLIDRDGETVIRLYPQDGLQQVVLHAEDSYQTVKDIALFVIKK